MKKTPVYLLLGVLILTVIMPSQVFTQSEKLLSPESIKIRNLKLPVPPGKSDPRFDLDKLNLFKPQEDNPVEQHYYMDTVLVLSIANAPFRYIYSYSPSGYNVTYLIQNYIDGDWINSTVENLTYDEVGNVITSLWKVWISGNWINYKVYQNTYTNSRMVNSISQLWVNNNWENATRETYDYDSFGNVVAHLSETWQQVSWINVAHELYTYNAERELLTEFHEKWINGSWINEVRYTNVYDNTGNLLTGLTEEWKNGSWQNAYRYSYIYDANRYLRSYIGEAWLNGFWVYIERYSYNYDASGYLLTGTAEIFSNGQWTNNEKASFSYDIYGGVQTLLLEKWLNGGWTNFTLSAYDYDGNGNAVLGRYYKWDGETWTQNQDGTLEMYYDYSNQVEPYSGYQVQAHYKSFNIGIGDTYVKGDPSIICVPNPSRDHMVLIVRLKFEEFIDLAIYDQMGRKMQKVFKGVLGAGESNFSVDLANLTSGIYLARLTGHRDDRSFKLIIQK